MKTNMRVLKGCAAVLGAILKPLHKIKRSTRRQSHNSIRRKKDNQSPRFEIRRKASTVTSDPSRVIQEATNYSTVAADEEPESAGDGSASTSDFVLDKFATEDFVSEPRVAQVEGCISILPDAALSAGLRTAILAHRRIKAAEAEADAEIATLGPRYKALQEEIEAMSISAAEDAKTESYDDMEPCCSKSQRIEQLTDEKNLVFKRLSDLRADLERAYEDVRGDQMDLMDMLEGFLCESAELPVHSEVEAEETSAQTSANESETGPESASGSAHAHDDIEDPVRAEERQTLLYNLHIFSGQLSFAEEQLECRDLLFCVEREEGRMPAAGGTEAALLEFQRVQELTQKIAAAERDYNEARAACLAAGVQAPGSHIESGFVDDVGDGYRISAEHDLVTSIDSKRIQRWLAGIEVADAGKMDTSGIAELDSQIDDWDAQDVSISDSWSMVADGAQKRRIQKCREQEDAIRKAIACSCMEG